MAKIVLVHGAFNELWAAVGDKAAALAAHARSHASMNYGATSTSQRSSA